ncbi:DUF4145 domain-containing protein [Parageobacillus toebii]|uniref:DUF4145 domain-containing protein n=1 Tax=Parageobacillus toebii TaxID=153151 RepID=UPI002816117F|nr:DUF4145 domain-containing protein [Parageobacillus toebii]WMT18168.1 DUF4145 domain-containing protein [Parageobacillus toebii]
MNYDFSFLSNFYPDVIANIESSCKYYGSDNNASLMKSRLAAEQLTDKICKLKQIPLNGTLTQFDKLNLMREVESIPTDIISRLDQIRKIGNRAVN